MMTTWGFGNLHCSIQHSGWRNGVIGIDSYFVAVSLLSVGPFRWAALLLWIWEFLSNNKNTLHELSLQQLHSTLSSSGIDVFFHWLCLNGTLFIQTMIKPQLHWFMPQLGLSNQVLGRKKSDKMLSGMSLFYQCNLIQFRFMLTFMAI